MRWWRSHRMLKGLVVMPAGENCAGASGKPNLVKLSLARTIAALFLSQWKHEEEYDPARHRAT